MNAAVLESIVTNLREHIGRLEADHVDLAQKIEDAKKTLSAAERELKSGGNGEVGATRRKRGQNRKAIQALLAENPHGLLAQEIADKTGISTSSVSAVLTKEENESLFSRDSNNRWTLRREKPLGINLDDI